LLPHATGCATAWVFFIHIPITVIVQTIADLILGLGRAHATGGVETICGTDQDPCLFTLSLTHNAVLLQIGETLIYLSITIIIR